MKLLHLYGHDLTISAFNTNNYGINKVGMKLACITTAISNLYCCWSF
jgi:hypothetical protein